MHKKTVLFILLLVVVVGGFVWSSRSRTQAPATAPASSVSLKSGDTYELVASKITKQIDGNNVSMLAYNGLIPGPTIRVHEGDQITVHFVNKTDKPTLLHSHGVRLDNAFDGTDLVQKNVMPGESFDYVLKFNDPGVYWYHPHVREDMEQPMGLYGNFVVIPNDPNYFPAVDHEETLVLSDVLMEGTVVAPYSDKYVTHALMGRFGNTLLVNGNTAFKLNAEPGEVHRLYITNAATVRPFNFRIKGAKMKLVGGDNGRYEKETFVDSIVIAPSERYIVDVLFSAAGTFAIENVTPAMTYTLGSAVVSGTPVNSANKTFSTLRTNAEEAAQFADLRHYLNEPVDKHLTLTMTMDMAKIMSYLPAGTTMHAHTATGAEMTGMSMPGMDMSGMNMGSTSTSTGMSGMMMATSQPIEYDDNMGDMNTFSTNNTVKWIIKDVDTGKENMDIKWALPLGKMVKIRIDNDPKSGHPMQHPIHFHGNRFVVLSRNGIPNDNMVWKDTTMLQTGESVDILLEAVNPGNWMAHCHIAEHMHSGMMFSYTVE